MSRGVFYLPDDVDGLIIAWVAPDTKAATVLESGDVVTAVDGRPIDSGEAPAGADSAAPSSLRLTVLHNGTTSDVLIPLQSRPPVNLIVRLESTPNAFATTQSVIVTTGLLDLASDDDLLAAVVGHELAHISRGHTTPSLSQLLLTVPIELLLPGVGHAAITATKAPFVRDQEREADRDGMQLARQAGYDASGAWRILEKLEAAVPAEDDFFATHPSFPERISTARAAAEANQ